MRDDKVCHIPRDRSIILLFHGRFYSRITKFNERFNSERKFFSEKPIPIREHHGNKLRNVVSILENLIIDRYLYI